MNINQILLYVGGTILASSLVSNYILFSKLEQKKAELLVCEISSKNLQLSIDRQNKAIESLKSETSNAQEKYLEISKKYNTIIKDEEILNSKVKELTNKGVTAELAICKVNQEMIEGAVNVFFSKK